MRPTNQQEPEQGGGPEGLTRARIDPAAPVRLLDEWMQGDEAEQRDTFEFLCRALDEDRPADYKLFL